MKYYNLPIYIYISHVQTFTVDPVDLGCFLPDFGPLIPKISQKKVQAIHQLSALQPTLLCLPRFWGFWGAEIPLGGIHSDGSKEVGHDCVYLKEICKQQSLILGSWWTVHNMMCFFAKKTRWFPNGSNMCFMCHCHARAPKMYDPKSRLNVFTHCY